jgi:manganese oxidase
MATKIVDLRHTQEAGEPSVLSWRSAAQLGNRPVERDPGAGARPGTRAALTAALAAVAAAVSAGLSALHAGVSGGLLGNGATAGATEGGTPLLLAWARDAALALPLIAAAVVLSAAAARRCRSARPGSRAVVQAALTGASAALALSVAVTARAGLQGGISGTSWAGQLASEWLLTVPLMLLTSGLCLALLAWRERQQQRASEPADTNVRARVQPGLSPRPARRRLRTSCLATLALAGATLALAPFASPASAAVSNPGAPCPAGAPQRTFDVTAIDVRITLNRTGDNDPAGKMLVVNKANGIANTYSLDPTTAIPRPDSAGNLSALAAVRNEEASRRVSIGERDDPIQPLAVRANEGDCVTITFHNNASGGSYGLHIDGLAFASASSGDAIGKNVDSSVAAGGTSTFRYFVPDNRNLEGSHYVHPGPGYRSAVDHGLFGMLTVEPKGSSYLDANTGNPLITGWEATIVPAGAAAFREALLMHHEVGNDNEKIFDRAGKAIPQVDSTTGSYRPGEFALNYRSEPFRNRLLAFAQEKSHSYSSYTFGDPSTPMPRGYIGDPTKFRISHASGEKFHVYHLHGGGDRWRMNPVADPSWNYADTRLNKHPQNEVASNRLDSQSLGPGESYNLELEGGAGGVQHTVGDLLFHCHIAKHYVSGMWSFWRVYNTLQPDFAALPDRTAPSAGVTSDQLIGKNFSGSAQDATQTINNAKDLDAWVRQQLPPQGVKATAQDPSVLDWTYSKTNPGVALGEPEDITPQGTGAGKWPNQSDVPKHPGLLASDLQRNPQGTPTHPAFTATTPPVFFGTNGAGKGRPAILFNPVDGRPAYPMLRAHIGSRPPFSPQGHSGSPLLGEVGDALPATQHSTATDPVSAYSPGPIDSAFPANPDPTVAPADQSTVDPYAYRPDGLCPATTANGQQTPTRHFNIVAIATPVQRSATVTDEEGKLFTLAQDKQKVYHDPTSQPLALRVNVGDCAKVTLTSEIPDTSAFDGFSKTSIHIHHVQFDVQGSDGVSTGFAYEHSVRPYSVEDSTLTAPSTTSDSVLHLSSVAKFQDKTADGAPSHPFIGVGMGSDGLEVRQVLSVDPAALTVTLDKPLANPHGIGEFAGFEFIQYEWYADTQLDNIFWHDHVDGIHGWGHGLVGQLIVEPAGSKYYAPNNHTTELASGTIADIVVDKSAPGYQNLLPGRVNGSFRELALWTINDNDSTNYSTLNLKAAPFTERPSAANRFSSYVYGDPITPMLRGYPSDPLVVRTISVSPTVDTLRFQGQRFTIDGRMTTANGAVQGDPSSGTTLIGSQVDTIHYGVSEKYTISLGGNGPDGKSRPGDYLYFNGDGRRLEQGAWGIVRVLGANAPDLLPLPDNPAPGGTWIRPASAATPPQPVPGSSDTANVCPAGAPVKFYDITALNLGTRALFAESSTVAALKAGTRKPEPLVLHVAAGDCLQVRLINTRDDPTSFAVGKLDRSAASSGVNVGYSPDSTALRRGGTRMYTYYADNAFLGSATIADFAGKDSSNSQKLGMYGAVIVSPAGATFGPGHSPTAVGAQVDVHLPAPVTGPARKDYRDVTLLLADNDPRVGQDTMPYPTNAAPFVSNINYQVAPNGDNTAAFHDVNGVDPATPVVKTYAGDPLLVHEMVAPGSEQSHVFSLGGLLASRDMFVPGSELTSNQAIGPGESFDAWVEGGAGGFAKTVGDFFYGDLRRPFTQEGIWGLLRVMPPPADCGAVTELACLSSP